MRMRRISCIFLAASVLSLQASCAPGEEFHFQTFSDFKKSDVYVHWSPEFIPEESREISFWYDVESGLVRASFLFDGKRPVSINGMRKLSDSKLDIAKAPYPEVQGLRMTILYSCDVREIGTKLEPLHYTEVEFIGDTGTHIFYWNSLSKDVFHQVCDDSVRSSG